MHETTFPAAASGRPDSFFVPCLQSTRILVLIHHWITKSTPSLFCLHVEANQLGCIFMLRYIIQHWWRRMRTSAVKSMVHSHGNRSIDHLQSVPILSPTLASLCSVGLDDRCSAEDCPSPSWSMMTSISRRACRYLATRLRGTHEGMSRGPSFDLQPISSRRPSAR